MCDPAPTHATVSSPTRRWTFRPPAGRGPVVVGFGPCGLFAALVLAQMGLRPLVLERGRAVRERTQDTWGLWRRGVLDAESNVQFGEGGAGTFLRRQAVEPDQRSASPDAQVLDEFVKAGAPEEILYVAKPHIGTFRLVGMIEKMRAQIEALGGEIPLPDPRVTDIELRSTAPDAREASCAACTWHTGEFRWRPTRWCWRRRPLVARDTFAGAATTRGVHMEAKPFSIGFRIEHPQSVDRPGAASDPAPATRILGAAAYSAGRTTARNGRDGLQLLHVPGRDRGGRHVRAGPRRHQRHEPVLAQRAERELRASWWGSRLAGLSGRTSMHDWPGQPARRHRFSARAGESRAFVAGR